MGKNKKRKAYPFLTEPDGGHIKRSRHSPSVDEGFDDSNEHGHSRGGLLGFVRTAPIDPSTGQRGAFPGLEDDDPNEVFYGPAEDGLGYLRMVRSEAKGVPPVLVAPRENEDEEMYNSGIGDSRGYYSDGAYTAAPVLGPICAPDRPSDPKASYHESLRLRYKLLRASLRCAPPNAVITALDSNHPIFCPHSKASFRQWHYLLRTTDPVPAQLSQMDHETVLRLMKLLTRNTFLKRNQPVTRRVSAWAWGLLGRAEEVGAMVSEHVGIVRDLGKRAAWVIEGLLDKRATEANGQPLEDGDIDDDEEDYDLDVNPVEGNEQEGPALDGDPPDLVDPIIPTEDPGTNNIQSVDIPEAINAPLQDDSDLEEGEVSDSQPEPAHPDKLLEAKAHLMAQISGNADEGRPGKPQDQETANGNEESVDTVTDGNADNERENTYATLDMILTIVGEFFGQKDLLIWRDTLWSDLM